MKTVYWAAPSVPEDEDPFEVLHYALMKNETDENGIEGTHTSTIERLSEGKGWYPAKRYYSPDGFPCVVFDSMEDLITSVLNELDSVYQFRLAELKLQYETGRQMLIDCI